MMIRTLAVAAFLALAGLLTSTAGTQAAELVMFDDPSCVWCRRWDAEIAPSYSRTPEGQMAPLRRVYIRDQANAGIALARPVTGTPTFVLVHEGEEVGRIPGYPGSDFFYPQLAELLKKLPASEPAPRPQLRSTMR
jgi:protein-disulfide isomerase